MKKRNLILIGFLILLVLVNIILLYYSINVLDLSIIKRIKNELPLVKKSFIIQDPFFLALDSKSVIINNGNLEKPLLGSAMFKATINGDLYLNESSGEYFLPIKFTKQKNNIEAVLIIGTLNQNINILLAKKGIIPEGIEWTSLKPADILKYIKYGYPLIISIYLDEEVYDLFQKKDSCDTKCKLMINNYKKYSKNALKLFNNTSFNNNFNEPLKIGPVKLLVIYAK